MARQKCSGAFTCIQKCNKWTNSLEKSLSTDLMKNYQIQVYMYMYIQDVISKDDLRKMVHVYYGSVTTNMNPYEYHIL